MVQKFQSISVKLLIILAWMTLIFGALFLPAYFTRFGQGKVINIFAWSGMFDSAYVSKFENATGIRVNFSFYESNEELLVKLKATKGQGYDLIVPGDYTVDILRKEGLLKKLDKSKMPFFENLNPMLLDKYFDPENNYSLPFEWAVFGIGYDKDFFNNEVPPATWGLVFDPKLIHYKFVMVNDPLLSIPIAAFYLYGTLDNFNAEKLAKVKELLIKQRKWVEAYTDARADYLVSTKNCPVVVSSSSYVWRGMREYPHVGFVIPKEGTLITIENFAIPITSDKEELVYEFLKFVYSPETTKYHFETFGFFPATIDIFDHIEFTTEVEALLKIKPEDFSKFDFLRLDELKDSLTEQDLQDAWITVKS